MVGALARRKRTVRRARGIPMKRIHEPLPVFMLCASVGEVLGRKPATITMADDTFTGTNLWE